MRRSIAIACAVLLFSAPAAACWINVTLEGRLREASLVVVGEVVVVERSASGETYDHDRATLAVRRVLKGGELVPRSRRVVVRFPSVNNQVRVSTDIRYDKGDRGVWLLTRDGESFEAAHPLGLVPIEHLRKIERLLGITGRVSNGGF
jgi:hypothetical protein